MSANSDSQASSSSPGPPSAIQRVTRRLARSTLTLSKVEGVQNEDGDELGMSTARATMDSDDDSASSGVTTRPPNSSLSHSDHEEHADSEQSTSLDSEQLRAQYSGSTGSQDSDLSPSTCQLCFDTPDTLIALTCGHTYCKQCLNRLFKTGTANPRSFPPKCCKDRPIELTAVQVYLDDDVFRRYNDVYSEFSDGNRLYCANKCCGSYIRQSRTFRIGRSIMCGGCGTYTCVDCKQVRDEHVIQDGLLQCTRPEQLMSAADRKLANTRGWKQCPGCKNLIEKTEGCDHHTVNPSGERTVDSSTGPPRAPLDAGGWPTPRPNFIESMLEESSERAKSDTTGEETSMTRENVKPGTKQRRSEEDE
ncbi:hypothetical protein PV11_01386 [Exophiala sideris]|uniref:RING-type domain-containing protein n=1 Tax=Exophiala sideris TaxID=1016849 RepID=A0A0D1WA72_9EURO|nr:hypothetical protein PV11_01386 [Exophiala sideris]